MRTTSLKFSLLALVAVALVVATAPRASADTIETFSQNGVTATVDVNSAGTAATVSLSGPSNFFVYDVGLMLGGSSTSSGSGSSSVGSFTFLQAQHPNNCSGGSNPQWLCASSGSAVALNGLTLTFNFTGTTNTPYSLHFIICDTATTCVQGKDGFVTIFSQTGTGVTPVPEPGTLSFLGTGLIGIAGLVRRRFVK